MFGPLESYHHDPFSRNVGVNDTSDQQGRETETIGDSLDERTSTTQGRRSNVLTTEIVYDNADNLGVTTSCQYDRLMEHMGWNLPSKGR